VLGSASVTNYFIFSTAQVEIFMKTKPVGQYKIAIEHITPERAGVIIDTRKPLGLFCCHSSKDGLYIGIDNTRGHAWTEEFNTLRKCKRWLNDPSIEVGN
jgi:hypothetical protein